MPSRAVEELHLFQARQHVITAQRCVARQRAAIAQLIILGASPTRAKELLTTMEKLLGTFKSHEQLVQQTLSTSSHLR